MATHKPQLDSHIRVVTPENIAFEYRVASPFERLLAYLIDMLIISIIVAGLGLAAMFVLGIAGAFTAGVGVAMIVWFVVCWFYGGVFETLWNGQTPGKRSLGLRVVRTNGSPIDAGQAVLRNFLRLLDGAPTYTYLVGLISASVTQRYQRLGDLACGTMVVAEDRSRAARFNDIKDVLMSPIENMLPPGALPSRTLARAISRYVDRRRYFGPARRAEIARHVGEVFAQQYNLPAGIDHDALLCVLYRRAFLTARDESGLELEAQPVANPVLAPPPPRDYELLA